jgi:hypothetical protein
MRSGKFAIKSRRMEWAQHVVGTDGAEECIQVFGGKARREKATRKT